MRDKKHPRMLLFPSSTRFLNHFHKPELGFQIEWRSTVALQVSLRMRLWAEGYDGRWGGILGPENRSQDSLLAKQDNWIYGSRIKNQSYVSNELAALAAMAAPREPQESVPIIDDIGMITRTYLIASAGAATHRTKERTTKSCSKKGLPRPSMIKSHDLQDVLAHPDHSQFQ